MSKSDMIYTFYIWPLMAIGTVAVIGLIYYLLLWVMEEDEDE